MEETAYTPMSKTRELTPFNVQLPPEKIAEARHEQGNVPVFF